MATFVECPEEGCVQASEVLEVYVLRSTDGPVRHAKLLCLSGHRFDMPEIGT